jgi:hypothetical protein
MSTFQPSSHSYGYGSADLVRIEEQYVDPDDRFENFGVFIAEENPGIPRSIWFMATAGTAAGLSYRKNKSFLWAGLSMIAWPIALPYYIIHELTSK